MTNDVEYLCICLFTICISSLARCLLRFLAYFLIQSFVFLLLNFKSSLCILGNSHLSDMSLANIFSQSLVYFFILLSHIDFFLMFSSRSFVLHLN